MAGVQVRRLHQPRLGLPALLSPGSPPVPHWSRTAGTRGATRGTGVHHRLLSLPSVTGTRLQEGHKTQRGAARWPHRFWESHWAPRMAVPWWRVELGELTIRRDLPVQCGQGRAGSRQSLRCGAAGLQCFPALRYLLRLHLLQGIAVHVPLRVTGHLATLKRLGGRSQPTSWKGSTQLSHGQRWQGREAFWQCLEGSRSSAQPQGNRSTSIQEGSICMHGARQKETEAQRGKERAVMSTRIVAMNPRTKFPLLLPTVSQSPAHRQACPDTVPF